MGTARIANTQAEGLQNILQEIAKLKLTPDADISFLVGLETEIIKYLRQPIQNMANQLPPYSGATGAPGMPSGAQPGPPGAGPPMPAPQPAGMGAAMGAGGPPPGPGINIASSPLGARLAMMNNMNAAVPGLGPGPGAPNPDEVRRMIGHGH